MIFSRMHIDRSTETYLRDNQNEIITQNGSWYVVGGIFEDLSIASLWNLKIP